MLPDDPDRGVKDAFMHCHLAFDGVPKQPLESYFEGHSAVAFEILQGVDVYRRLNICVYLRQGGNIEPVSAAALLQRSAGCFWRSECCSIITQKRSAL